MSKHTEGKWFWFGKTLRTKQEDHNYWNGKIVEFMETTPNAQANRNLIASAPEMLKMLIVVKGVIETQICEREMKNVEQFCIEDLDNIRNLIAKAEGGAK